MAKITELPATSTVAATDLLAVVTNVATTPTTKKISFTDLNATTVAAATATSAQRASNLSDLASVVTARTNLGLGTAATTAATAYETAGAGAAAVATSAQRASNLSDLASVITARTNLGLGGAATLAVGTTTGTVAAGDDSRIVGANQNVATIAALRALASSARTGVVAARGYYAAGDGGGGLFLWDSASTAVDDGGITILPTGLATAGRWVRMNTSGTIEANHFGFLPGRTYAQNDAVWPSVTAAVLGTVPPVTATQAYANGKTIRIGPGLYNVSNLLIQSIQGLHLDVSGATLVSGAAVATVLLIDGMTQFSQSGRFDITGQGNYGSAAVTDAVAVEWTHAGTGWSTSMVELGRINVRDLKFVNGITIARRNHDDVSLCSLRPWVYGNWTFGENTYWQNGVLLGDGTTGNVLNHYLTDVLIHGCKYGVRVRNVFPVAIRGGEIQFCSVGVSHDGDGSLSISDVRMENVNTPFASSDGYPEKNISITNLTVANNAIGLNSNTHLGAGAFVGGGHLSMRNVRYQPGVNATKLYLTAIYNMTVRLEGITAPVSLETFVNAQSSGSGTMTVVVEGYTQEDSAGTVVRTIPKATYTKASAKWVGDFGSDSTANRPSWLNSTWVGSTMYDTTLAKQIWWDGTAWQTHEVAGAAAAAQTAAIAVSAQRASNLSDLASAATARTNLGLGGAATLSVGTGVGTVAAGDDSRIIGANQSVATVAALRALGASARYGVIALQGYYAAGDGGGGQVRWDSASTAADDAGLTFLPTGLAGAGRWVRLLPKVDEIDVAYFGAKPYATDATTQHVAIQAAVTAAGARTVRIDREYAVGSSIVLVSGSHITGSGTLRDVIGNLSILNVSSVSNVEIDGLRFVGSGILGVAGRGAVWVQTSSNVRVHDIYARNLGTCGVAVGDCSDVHVWDVYVQNTAEHGVYFNNTTTSTIHHVRIDSAGQAGGVSTVIGLKLVTCTDVRVTDVTVSNSLSEGVLFEASTRCSLHGGRLTGNAQRGFRFFGTGNVSCRIKGVEFDNNTTGAFRDEGSTNCVLQQCTFHRAGTGNPIDLTANAVSGLRITGNDLLNAPTGGWALTLRGTGVHVNGNRILGAVYGIKFYVTASGCTVRNNEVAASTLAYDDDNTVAAAMVALVGSGTPEGNVKALIGSTYTRADGGASTSFYVKESGTAATGWAAK